MSAATDDSVDARLAVLAWRAVERFILPKMLEIHEAALRQAFEDLRGQAVYFPKRSAAEHRRRNEAMRADSLGGMCVDEIAAKHHLSRATVVRLLKDTA